MVEGPNFVNPVPVSAATPTRPSAPPTARCLSDTCVLQGRPECFDYCLPCARRLGLVDSNFTLPSVATPARSIPPPAPATAPEGGSCRGQCGFFGAPERCGLCSSCFAKIRDDSYLVALAGAVVNRVEAVTQYVALGGSLKRCVTSAEADVLRSLHFYVADGASLSKIAHECNSNEVLMYVLSEDQGSPADEAYKRKTLSSLLPAGPAEWGGNGADNDEEPAIADDVRLEFISTQQRRDDGLVYYDPTAAGTATTKIASCFVLPPALSAMPHDVRVAHLHHYQEQPEMLSDITKATAFFSAVPQCSQLFPVYTVADLNCLLHSAFTSMLGVRDGILASDDPTSSRATTRTVLRESMRNSLRECNILQAAVAPSTAPDASVLDVDHTRLEQVLHDIELGKASLDGGHVFTLANVLRRPIVVWAQVEIEGSFRHVLRVPFRASGIYLPLLWKPDEVLLDPLYLCYSSGHFSSLVGFANESNDDCDEQTSHVYRVVAPLCDEQFVPLPIHFADSPVVVELLESRGLPRIVMMPEEAKTRHSPAEMALLSAYIRLAGTAKLMDDDDDSAPIITLAEQWVPKDASQTTRSPTQTQQYTEHLWKALAELTASKPVNPPRRAADADDVYDV